MRDYQWGDVLPIEQQGGQPQQQAKPNGGLFDQLFNPMTMAGLAGMESAWRGGNAFPAMQSGMQMGLQQEQARRQAVQQAALQNILKNPQALGNLPPALLEIARATGDAGPLTQFLVKQADPNAGRTDDIKEYEYALRGGFKGSLQDWMVSKRASQGEYAKNVVYGTRTLPDGRTVTVPLQPGTRGDLKESALPEGVTLESGFEKFDAGDKFILIDKASRQPVGTVPKNLAEAERQKTVGEAQGKAQIDLPGVQSNAENLFRYIDGVANDPNLDKMLGYGGYLLNVTPEAKTLQSKINQLNSQGFLIAFQGLKGAGAITEQEGKAATAALTRLQEQVQDGKDYREALRDFRSEVARMLETARRKAGAGGPNGNAGWGVRRIE